MDKHTATQRATMTRTAIAANLRAIAEAAEKLAQQYEDSTDNVPSRGHFDALLSEMNSLDREVMLTAGAVRATR